MVDIIDKERSALKVWGGGSYFKKYMVYLISEVVTLEELFNCTY